MTLELLRQVRVVDAVSGTDQSADVLLEQGTIQAIAPSLTPPEGTAIRDGQGLVLGQGLVDLYSRSGEPGHEDRETLDSLFAAAQAGGFTRLNLLPQTQPAIDNPASVSWFETQIEQRSGHASKLKVGLWGALTLDTAGQQMTELGDLANGTVGFSDGKPIVNWSLLRRLLEYSQPLQKPLMLWACDPGLTGNGIAREGSAALRFGLPGIPTMAEVAPLAAILEILREIPTPIHLMRVSTARSIELIAAAKSEGLPITASTTWMHLLWDTTDLASYDPNLRLSPPLGNATDRTALIQAVKSGVIDAIAVDHQPYTYEEKTVAFGEAPAGAIGLELALPMLWHHLVESGHLSAIELWRGLSQGAAHCLGQSLTAIQPDQREIILLDPQATWTVSSTSLKSRSYNTHLLDRAIQGQVLAI